MWQSGQYMMVPFGGANESNVVALMVYLLLICVNVLNTVVLTAYHCRVGNALPECVKRVAANCGKNVTSIRVGVKA